jgi:hypothetical protein
MISINHTNYHFSKEDCEVIEILNQRRDEEPPTTPLKIFRDKNIGLGRPPVLMSIHKIIMDIKIKEQDEKLKKIQRSLFIHNKVINYHLNNKVFS